MAITSVGYAGTINAPDWARLAPFALGMQYGVKDFAAWRPTVGGAGDRAVTIAAGVGWGHGVMDTSDAPVTLNLPSVTSGARWDLIVARRVWGTKVTSIQRVAGAAVKQIPTRLHTPGTEDEQPIALVRVVAGSATVAELIDLRCVPGDSGLIAFNELALQYLTRPATRVRISGFDWVRDIDATGNPVWVQPGMDAHAGKANGFQNMSGGKFVKFDLQTQRGGFTTVDDGSALVFPVSGLYRVTARCYLSGGGAGEYGAAIRQVGDNSVIQWLHVQKPSGGSDASADTSFMRPFAAGSGVRMWLDVPIATWGSTGYDGCYLEAELIR